MPAHTGGCHLAGQLQRQDRTKYEALGRAVGLTRTTARARAHHLLDRQVIRVVVLPDTPLGPARSAVRRARAPAGPGGTGMTLLDVAAGRQQLRRVLGRADTVLFLISAMVVAEIIGAIAADGGQSCCTAPSAITSGWRRTGCQPRSRNHKPRNDQQPEGKRISFGWLEPAGLIVVGAAQNWRPDLRSVTQAPAGRSVGGWQAAPFTVCPAALRRGQPPAGYLPGVIHRSGRAGPTRPPSAGAGSAGQKARSAPRFRS